MTAIPRPAARSVRTSIRVSARTVVILLLAATLLLAQWLGLTHRIAHADLSQAHDHVAVIPHDDSGDDGAHHSCTAFDAATVGDALHISSFVLPLLSSARLLAAWAPLLCWDSPPTLFFSSRAPPRA